MLSPDNARDKLADLVARAAKAGADAADAITVSNSSSSVHVREGQTEDVSRSESEATGLRVFVGTRSASASTSDLSSAAMDALVERVVAMAREAPEDPYAGLAPQELLATGPFPDIDGWDPVEPDPAALKARALEAEDAARAVPGVTKSNGAGAGASAATVAVATSHGFAGAYRSSGHSVSASVIAGEGATMQRDHDWHSARHLEDLEPAALIGRRAGERAVKRVGAVQVAPGVMPVLFDPRVASSLISHLMSAISGAAIARKTSFLLDALDTQIFARGIDILDDPLRRRGLRSRASTAKDCRSNRRKSWKTGFSQPGWRKAPRPANSASSPPAMPRAGSAARPAPAPPTSRCRPGRGRWTPCSPTSIARSSSPN